MTKYSQIAVLYSLEQNDATSLNLTVYVVILNLLILGTVKKVFFIGKRFYTSSETAE